MQKPESWDSWRFFLAVARTGSLSAAGRRLGVNQSTVFRRIGQLEGALGARLFDRLPRGYALTALGEQVLPTAERLEEDVQALGRAVSGADRALRGTIRFTTVLELFDVITEHLSTFHLLYPGILLDVSTEARVLRLGRHEADVALRPGMAPTEPDVIGRKLRPSPTAVYASAAYLQQRGRPALGALDGHTAVRFSRASASPLAGAPVAIRVDSMKAQAVACRAGLGLAHLPCFLGDPDPLLVRVSEPMDAHLHLWLLIHADLRRTARVRAFTAFLADALAGR